MLTDDVGPTIVYPYILEDDFKNEPSNDFRNIVVESALTELHKCTGCAAPIPAILIFE